MAENVPAKEKLSSGPTPKWNEIVGDPAFVELPGDQKEQFRQAYRDKILKPMIAPQNWPTAQSEFDKATKGTTVAGPFENIGRHLWKGLTYDQATLGPNLVETIFLGTNDERERAVGLEKQFQDLPGGAAVYKPVVRRETVKSPEGKELREKFSRYKKMVAEATGTEYEKAAPGPVSHLAGEAAELLGAGGAISAKNILTRPGTVGKVMQAGREVLSSAGAAGGMGLAQSFGEHMMPDSPTARAMAILAGGAAGGGALEMAVPTSLEMAWYRGKELNARSQAMIKELVAQGMEPGKAKSAAQMMVSEIEQFRKSSLGKEFSKALEAQPNAAIFAKEAKEAASKIPDFHPNMAMATGSKSINAAGLAAAERDDHVAMAINASQVQALRALNLYAESMITSGAKTAKQAVDEITKSDLYNITKELNANQSKWMELNERLTSGDFFTKKDGEALIGLRNDAARLVQRSFEEQYKSLYQMADEAGFQMNMGDFYNDILRIEADPRNVATKFPSTYDFLKRRIGKLSDVEKKTSELADLQTRLGQAEGGQATMLQNRIRALRQEIQGAEKTASVVPSSMEEVHSFYKAINSDLNYSTLMPNEARLLNSIKADLVDRIKGTNEGVYQTLDQINKNYVSDYVDVFRKGAAGRMVNETKFGLQTPEQDMLKPFLSRGAQGREEFKRVFGNDATSGQLVSQAMADNFAAYVKDKTITPDLVKRFVAQHKDFLEGFPNVQKSFSDIETAAATLEKRGDELATMKDNVVTAQVRTLLNSTEPEKVLLQNIKSQDFMTRLHSMAKQNPEAAQAFAYEYGEIVKKMDPRQASDFLIAHKAELKPIFDAFDPTLYDKLSILSLGKQVYERGFGRVQYEMQIEPGTIRKTLGMHGYSALNRIFWTAQGKTGNLWNTMYMGAKFFGAQNLAKWNHLLADAFTNPEFVDKLIAEQYGPLLLEAQKRGVSIEELVKTASENPQLAESLKNTLTDLAKKGKQALDEANLGHSFKAHGYRVLVGGAQRAEESAQAQEGKRERSPYWSPQGLRLLMDTARQ